MKKNSPPLLRNFSRILLITIFSFAIVACTSTQPRVQDALEKPIITPPVPKEPVTTLLQPEAPPIEPLRGRAAIPEGVSLGFALDVAEVILTDDWKVIGTVRAIEPSILEISTDQGQLARLAYRLPEGMALTLEPGQPISLNRSTEVIGASLDYRLDLTSKVELVLASASWHSNLPIELEIWAEISLRQSDEVGKELSLSEYETTYFVPVEVSDKEIRESIEPGRIYEFEYEGQRLALFIVSSQQTVPNPEFEGVLEGYGYLLEYVLIRY